MTLTGILIRIIDFRFEIKSHVLLIFCVEIKIHILLHDTMSDTLIHLLDDWLDLRALFNDNISFHTIRNTIMDLKWHFEIFFVSLE